MESKIKKNMADQYVYRVTWKDGVYIGCCLEFPSLNWVDKTPDLALEGIRGIVSTIIKNQDQKSEFES